MAVQINTCECNRQKECFPFKIFTLESLTQGTGPNGTAKVADCNVASQASSFTKRQFSPYEPLCSCGFEFCLVQLLLKNVTCHCFTLSLVEHLFHSTPHKIGNITRSESSFLTRACAHGSSVLGGDWHLGKGEGRSLLVDPEPLPAFSSETLWASPSAPAHFPFYLWAPPSPTPKSNCPPLAHLLTLVTPLALGIFHSPC